MAFNPFPSQVSPVEINDLPEKVSPVGNDEIQISDSENSNAAKKIKISSLPSGSGGGVTSLDQLTDVSVPSPTNGQALVYSNTSSQWEAQTISSGGATNLDGLTDVAIVSPAVNQVLRYSGTSWSNASLSKSSVGLGNVDNTSDANKPISTATQTALDTKQNTLVSTTNIKTINGISILGSGDLAVNIPVDTVSEIIALDIDWNSAGVFYKDISSSTTFTFSNVGEGKAITVILTNTSTTSEATIGFPSGVYKEFGLLTLGPNTTAIFSFIRANSKTFLASLKDLTNI
jgi:hypothetical protein